MQVQFPWTQEGSGGADAAGPGVTVSEWQEPKVFLTLGHPFTEGFVGRCGRE